MSRFCNVWQDVEGCIEMDNLDVNYIVTWVKDLVTGNTEIDDIKEVWCIDANGDEDTNYYPANTEKVRDAIYSDAYAKGEPDFEDEHDISYTDIKEAFAEQERRDL